MKKTLPRHAAGSFELKEGTGPITAMCSCVSFLEIYKVDKTFRVLTPESVDPEETNPNAPWVASPVSDVGSSHPAVARVLLQSTEMLKAALFREPIDKEEITVQLHSCKEALVACDLIAKRVTFRTEAIISEVSNIGVSTDNRGRGLNPFPQVVDLETDCATFLIQANRAIKLICEFAQLFFSFDRPDSNFDHLGNRLATAVGEDTGITKFVRANAGGVRYLVDLRNYHEHPKKKIRTAIENFRVLPDRRIQVPSWRIIGIDGYEPNSISDEMSAAVGFLLDIAESMFINLVLHHVSPKFPYIIEGVPEESINEKCPIRYRLSLDVSKLKFT